MRLINLSFSFKAQNLTRVHHKYLVSLIGYCIEKASMALVYEYMQQGTLQDKLTGASTSIIKILVFVKNKIIETTIRKELKYI